MGAPGREFQGEGVDAAEHRARRGWSVLGLALAWAALGTLFVLNHFEPAGSVAFWFNLVTPLAFRCPARCWSATGPPT